MSPLTTAELEDASKRLAGAGAHDPAALASTLHAIAVDSDCTVDEFWRGVDALVRAVGDTPATGEELKRLLESPPSL